tara:strand:- start:687 stop:1052 length:366 start_codon:yes stop_codon:yes gene_type:complete
MANTFKLKTHKEMPDSAGTPLDLYTVPSGTTTVVLGLMLCNIHTSQVTADVKLVSNTADGTETNETVFLVKDIPIPAGSSVELLAGNKVVLQYANSSGDKIQIDCDVADKIDATLSIMEIT